MRYITVFMKKKSVLIIMILQRYVCVYVCVVVCKHVYYNNHINYVAVYVAMEEHFHSSGKQFFGT